MLFVIAVLCHADSHRLELSIEANGLVKTIQDYCNGYKPEEFNTLETILNVKDDDLRKQKEASYIKSLATQDDLKLFFEQASVSILFNKGLSPKDKENILESFHLLYEKLLTETKVGIVNIELANSVGKFIVAMSLSINGEASLNIDRDIGNDSLELDCFTSDKYFEILRDCEELNNIVNILPATNTYQQVMQISNLECEAQTNQLTLFNIFIRKMKKENSYTDRKFNMLHRCRFSMDIIVLCRYHVLLEISEYWQKIKHTHGQSSKYKFDLFNDRINNNLSYTDREFLYFYYKQSTNSVENAYNILTDLDSIKPDSGNYMLEQYIRKPYNE